MYNFYLKLFSTQEEVRLTTSIYLGTYLQWLLRLSYWNQSKLIFWKCPMWHFAKIHVAGAELFHADRERWTDGQTGKTAWQNKQTDAFRNFASAT